ncbi:beta-propeller fold lactonase family protein [Buchnera aphidicola (Hormaphis cornu)]|nr:beta-propeller fold lactonase family protein [Buchnera aphidicola (Hormaphis cornu)]
MRPISQIITYKILYNGTLKEISKIKIIGFPNHISFDINEKFLFCSSYHGKCLNILTLSPLGIPLKIFSILKSINGCHYSNVDLNNTLYVTALKEDKIYLYNLLNNKNIYKDFPKVVNVKPSSGPRHLAIHPNKKNVYSINELNSTIDVWKHSHLHQTLYLLQNLKILPDEYNDNCWGADIHLTPCARYLYASDRHANVITSFAINSNNGKIQKLEHYVTEKQPRSFCIDELGKNLIVAGEKSNSITVYQIDLNNGFLYKMNSYIVGVNPIWILMHII